ncbi:MAG: DNA replication/repair protein RecF [Myxococcales bacterium]|nr:DNA replication/repair protein RecF [Myxococcales bacterium]
MLLHQLSLYQFRNIEQLSTHFADEINIFYGDNAQGKSNILEAIYLLCTLKSFRGSRNQELIRWNQPEGFVQAEVHRREIIRDLRVVLSGNRRSVFIDEKRAKSLDETFGHVHAVLFAPEDLAISKGAASIRRTFIDRAVFNAFPGYYNELKAYDQALRHRNVLLKRDGGSIPERTILDVFDQQLASLGARVMARRFSLIEVFRPIFRDIHRDIAGLSRDADLYYDPSVQPIGGVEESALEAALLSRLQNELRKDVGRGFTSSGPHVDDLVLMLDGRAARSHASQGQHRTLVLALKITEIKHLHTILGVPPLLLLDDVSSELDEHRNNQLMEHVVQSAGQVFMTTTDPKSMRLKGKTVRFCVQAGKLISELSS